MALVDNAWYVNYGNGSSTGYYAVAAWSNKTAAVGEIIRQATTPTVGNERCFVCIVGGATGSTEPTWSVTRGAKNVSSSATYQECTGVAALNGDATNTPTWTVLRTATSAATLGQVIQRDNGASYWICSTAGTMSSLGSEPAWPDDTAGSTRTDNGAVWTCLGVVGNFTGWQAPHARLSNAFAINWGAAGNTFYVSNASAETRSVATTLTSPGSLATPCFIYCVSETTVPPTSSNLTTGASITTTSTGVITFAGNAAYYRGVTFNCGSGAVNTSITVNNTSLAETVFDNCALNIVATGNNCGVSLGGSSTTSMAFKDCTFSFSHTAQGFFSGAWQATYSRFEGGSIASGAATPTTLFVGTSSYMILDGMDLSLLGSGKTIFGSGSTNVLCIMKNCKLGASVTKSATPTAKVQKSIIYLSDSSAVNYNQEQYTYTGTQTVETTIVRTGGASDGTTPIAWKIITTANSKWYAPYESLPLAVWNPTTGSNVTITVYGIWGGGAVPNNDEIWIEASYMGSSATPVATINRANTKADNLASGSAQSSDASSWGGSTTAFKMTVTLSSPQPQMAGYIYVTVKAAKASSTFYIDPKVVLS